MYLALWKGLGRSHAVIIARDLDGTLTGWYRRVSRPAEQGFRGAG
jgi:hypothetical protein